MRFRTDDRAVTVQIGTVLLFAVLIVLLSLYQATVVPQQNEGVEFNHNQQVQSELQDLRNELRRTAVTGTGGSATVTLGTRYPVRAVFVNPPPPSGTLRTTAAANVTVDNAVADGEVFDYWNGSARRFSTAGLVYQPEYSEYQDPPRTVYRNGLLYNRFAGANLTLGGQRLVQGDRISLVAVDGSFSEAGSGAESVDVQPVSTATRTVTVRNESASEPVTLVVPTSLSGASAVELWNDSLADQSRVETVEAATLAGGQSAVRVVLEPGSYELELAKVGVGTGVTGVDPHYVTVARGDNASVSAGGNQQVVVEVRDRFNNPVPGATVNVSDLGAPVTPTRAETDSNGRATFVYEAPDESGTERVAFNISRSPLAREKATAELFVDGGSGGGGNDTYDVDWTDASGPGLDCDPGFTDCTLDTSEGTSVDLTVNVSEGGDPVTGASVDYALNNSSFGDLSPGDGVTGDGEDRTTLTLPRRNGSVTVYAASGDDVDAIDVRAVDPREPGGNGTLTLDQFMVSDESVCSNVNPGGNCRGSAGSNYAQYTADWAVSDESGSDLSSVTVSLVAPDDTVADSQTYSVTGSSASGTTTLTDDGGYGDEYTVEIAATDDADNAVTGNATDVADGEGEYVGAGVDPGFAYEDVNGDGRYDQAVGDEPVPASELDGTFTAGDGNDLVVPDSVDGTGALDVSSADWTADSVSLDANVSSTGAVSITGRNGSVTATDRTLDTYVGGDGSGALSLVADATVNVSESRLASRSDLSLDAAGVDASNALLDTSVEGDGSGSVTVAATDEFDARDAVVESGGAVDVEAQTVSATGATLDNYVGGDGSGDLTILGSERLTVDDALVETRGSLSLDGGAVTAESGRFLSRGALDVGGDSVAASGAVFDNYRDGGGSGAATITATGDADLTDAVVQSSGRIGVDATSVAGVNATIDNYVGGDGSGAATVVADGDLTLADARVRSSADIEVRATAVSASGATVDNYRGGNGYGDLTLAGSDELRASGLVAETDAALSVDGGNVTADDARFEARSDFDVTADSFDATNATLDSYVGGDGSGSVTVDVGGAVTVADTVAKAGAGLDIEAGSVDATNTTFDNYLGGDGYGGVSVSTAGETRLEDAVVETLADLTVDAGSIATTNATFDNYVGGDGYGSATLTANGRAAVTDSVVESAANVNVEGESVDATNTTLDNYVGGDGYGSITVTATDGDAVLERGRVESSQTPTASVESGMLYVDDLVVRVGGSPGTLANPEDAPVDGEPEEGRVA
ncbi:beta strand repeat-containing protein [Halorussus halobius]|uniref:beta strand repeat-containing protein n=1 Tax=Halorussus halobius TaxID=1710537 RepID=UPI001091C940|nr:Ig-like domain-containing protein [Halorussus halobius]